MTRRLVATRRRVRKRKSHPVAKTETQLELANWKRRPVLKTQMAPSKRVAKIKSPKRSPPKMGNHPKRQQRRRQRKRRVVTVPRKRQRRRSRQHRHKRSPYSFFVCVCFRRTRKKKTGSQVYTISWYHQWQEYQHHHKWQLRIVVVLGPWSLLMLYMWNSQTC